MNNPQEFEPMSLPATPEPDHYLISPTVSPWDRGLLVAELQELLCAHGFTLKIDGDFGSITETAVRIYQRQQGLRVDGVVTAVTWKALRSTVRSGTRTLRLGHAGADVWELQGLLQIQGYAVPRDGQLGIATQQAILDFQRHHHLKPDGKVDSVTWRVLRGRPLPLPQEQSRWWRRPQKWW
jgi:peptidoglycan hydrolase-like protein with peptidoglycan-binding domain